jgi:hypothetical protein
LTERSAKLLLDVVAAADAIDDAIIWQAITDKLPVPKDEAARLVSEIVGTS